MTEKEIHTALYLCRCGGKIADYLDMDELKKWAKTRRNLSLIETHELLCSSEGKKFFEESIFRSKPESVLIAACSPGIHEKTFRSLAEENGINGSRIYIVNIREQVAWVTPGKVEATAKAKSLINAAISRCHFHEDLEKISMKCSSDFLVIGGGIAGIEAAITAARTGRKVTIVEKEISLGGNTIKTEEIAPEMESSSHMYGPRLSQIKASPLITLLTNAEVEKVMGFPGNFTIQIRKKARFVEEGCTGCEACFEVCPISIPDNFFPGPGNRKAIYTLFPGSLPATAAIDREHCGHFTEDSCCACVSECPFNSINFNDRDEKIVTKAGAIIIATGLEYGDPSIFEDLGYGILDNVLTLPEFERMLNPDSPYGGKVQLEDGAYPETIAVIHCAGSLRDDGGIPYCSGICCMGAAKVGELLRRQDPNIRVYNIHNDLVFPGPLKQNFLRKQIHERTFFIKCPDMSSVKVSKSKMHLQVTAEGLRSISVDMVILATGILPSESTVTLSKILHLNLTDNGFFKQTGTLLNETSTSPDGIYVVGCAKGPCDIETSITQARAAIGDAIGKLIPGQKIDLEMITSVIDEEKCCGCKICISHCPYNAITYDDATHTCHVLEDVCRGCGSCTAGCPGGASKAKHFTDEQLYAEIGGLLNE